MRDLTQREVDFGPLQELINDDTVFRIMVNGPNKCTSNSVEGNTKKST